jgi:hypothetical protein
MDIMLCKRQHIEALSGTIDMASRFKACDKK